MHLAVEARRRILAEIGAVGGYVQSLPVDHSVEEIDCPQAIAPVINVSSLPFGNVQSLPQTY